MSLHRFGTARNPKNMPNLFLLMVCLKVFGFGASNGLSSLSRQTEDAEVIKAIDMEMYQHILSSANPAVQKRSKRQFGIDYFGVVPTAPCITNRGAVGRCLTFKQCYPFFKVSSALSQYQSWLLSTQNTCTYMDSSGKQGAGICCGNNEFQINEIPFYPGFYPDNEESFDTNPFPPANWPPPVPTHPPDHTIPPLPTHPPSGVTSTTKSPKPTWPPPLPTHPTTPKPAMTPRPPTMHPDVEEIPTNYTECGIKNGYQDQERIVGGHNAEPGEWPWMVAILTNGRLFCGGSLIDSIHVLTAAHCVAHMNPWDVARLRINLGDYNIKSKGDVRHVERKVKKVVRHRGFDSHTLYNDIALLTLDMPVPFSQTIRPICLPRGKSQYSGRMATVIGWGSLREMGPTAGILQEVNIPIWTNTDCKSKYGPAAPGGIVETFLCAGKASKDSCSGDSGGPLMINDGKWSQIGIVSWGIGCGKGQYPGVYTRITSYMSWINKNLNT